MDMPVSEAAIVVTAMLNAGQVTVPPVDPSMFAEAPALHIVLGQTSPGTGLRLVPDDYRVEWVRSFPGTAVEKPLRPYDPDLNATVAVALKEVDELRLIGVGWDGERAPAPSQKSISQAEALLRITKQVVGDLDVSLHADGRVILEHQSADAYREVIVEPSGQFIVWSAAADGTRRSMALDVTEAAAALRS